MNFSKIYIENKASSYPLTGEIVDRLSGVETEYITHYKDVFDAAGQDFSAQKASPAIILAVNEGRRIYPGARPCQDFGHEHFYYTSQVKNCLYDCEYCFLRGMYPSGNIVIFVNIEDYFADIDALLKEHPVYLSVSYDTDLCGLEGLTGLLGKWFEYAAKRDDLLIELRTKCGSDSVIRNIVKYSNSDQSGSALSAENTGMASESARCEAAYGPNLDSAGEPVNAGNIKNNLVLAVTLSPDAFIRRFEHGTGSFDARLALAKKALAAGIRTRLCFDPVFPVKDFENVYGSMVDEVFSDPAMRGVEDVSVGSFRISSGYLKRMRRTALSPLTAYPYEIKNGMAGFDDETLGNMYRFMKNKLSGFIKPDIIFFS
ncbi:MAG: radical SAM protein [Lachnospiraceae bacterium]|nr:radical SAM protein [Lachnospiraceae bacterium]